MALTQIQQAMLADGILTADAAGRLKMADGFVNAAKLGAGAARANFGAGAVLQVVSTTKSNTSSSSASGVNDISGLSLSITPSNSSSKILLIGMISLSVANTGRVGANFRRDGNSIAVADADSSFSRTTVNLEGPANNANNMVGSNIMLFLDSPATASSITYTIAVSNFDNQTWYVNRNSSGTVDPTLARAISTITAMEIAG